MKLHIPFHVWNANQNVSVEHVTWPIPTRVTRWLDVLLLRLMQSRNDSYGLFLRTQYPEAACLPSKVQSYSANQIQWRSAHPSRNVNLCQTSPMLLDHGLTVLRTWSQRTTQVHLLPKQRARVSNTQIVHWSSIPHNSLACSFPLTNSCRNRYSWWWYGWTNDQSATPVCWYRWLANYGV